ncbi:MAG: glycosyltransferase family 29 protein [Lentisphaerae bacterium]|nr:glycosyltransferase family 29 protein [Lentisphaerota bacterium]
MAGERFDLSGWNQEAVADPDFARFLDGKRVAIVGPAPSIVGSRQHDLIESFDLVVRVNKALPVPEQMKPDVGSRTDILYNCLLQDEEAGGTIDFDTLREASVGYVCCPFPPIGGFAGNIEAFLAQNRDRFPFHHIDATFYENMVAVLQTRPNTGIATIADLLAHDIAALYITGFTFFQGGYCKTYRGYSQQEVMSRMAKAGNHAQAPQRLLVASLSRSDARVSVDRPLRRVLRRTELERWLPFLRPRGEA